MKMNKFRIFNYKSILDSGWCELSGDNITILAGQNEAGKTNILEALRDFDVDEKFSEATQPDVSDDLTNLQIEYLLDEDEVLYLELDADDNLVKAFEEFLINKGSIIVEKSFPDKYSFEAELRDEMMKEFSLDEKLVDGVAAELMRHTPYMVYFNSFSDLLPDKFYLGEIDKLEDIEDQSVIDFLNVSELDIQKLKTDEDPRRIGNYLDRHNAQITGEFLTYWTQNIDGKNKVQIIAERNHDENGYYLNFFVKDPDSKKYPIQRSRGFQWFLSFYLRLRAESIRKSEIGATVLIDEPGSYLHPKAQKDVLKLLEEKISPKHQVIFSTHSCDLIDPNRLNRVRLVINRENKGTIVSKIHSRDNHEDFTHALTPIIKAMGMDIGNKFDIAAKNNVILEGISDYYYLSTLRDKRGFSISPQIRLIPMAGVFSIPNMVSIMIGWGLKYVVIMDRDKNSDQVYDELTKKLMINNNQIYRLEGGKAIEDMFSRDDFTKLVIMDQSISIPTNKANSDYVHNDKELLSRRYFDSYKDNKIHLDEITKKNFKKIFEFIRSSFKA
ncbi:MAG: hypothetical protein C4524_02985 [Candidatus Zixiibacteriota bacterium]|nr:MAG: hypothetical protein C4524_02985 [candidate division Zixibacteria bacterium]